MKEDVRIAMANIEGALATLLATKQQHIVLEQNIDLIKKELQSCDCKRESELKEIVKK